jgi:hypothetical protein
LFSRKPSPNVFPCLVCMYPFNNGLFFRHNCRKKCISIDQVLTILIGSHMCIGCLDILKNILQFLCFFGILGIIWQKWLKPIMFKHSMQCLLPLIFIEPMFGTKYLIHKFLSNFPTFSPPIRPLDKLPTPRMPPQSVGGSFCCSNLACECRAYDWYLHSCSLSNLHQMKKKKKKVQIQIASKKQTILSLVIVL